MGFDWEEERQADEIADKVYETWMRLTDDMDEMQRRRVCMECVNKLLEGIQISLRSEQMKMIFARMMEEHKKTETGKGVIITGASTNP